MPSSVIIPLWLIVILLAILVLVGLGIRSAIGRISQSGTTSKSQSAASDPAVTDGQLNEPSAFESFLMEDPERLKLSKSEQFAAYREWRREKGMNWSNS